MSDMTPERAKKLLVVATPGPWRVDGDPWNRIVWSFPDNRVCFMSHSNGLDDARDIATSELVAAAPDLARAYLAQAAELTRLRSQVASADKLAEALIAARQVVYQSSIDRTQPEDAEAALRLIDAALQGDKT
jgi:hypothetical protein